MSMATVILIKERKLARRFQEAGATSPVTARSLGDLGASEGVAFRRLKERAVLREAKPGNFYLDEPSWGALRGTRRRLVALMLLGVAVGGGLWYFMAMNR